ncbi:sulfurtransferase TusA [Halomonas sp. MCCC 1A17488]|uniref:Sulfurtransferase TusA n=1 Tax=Billgrantia sulfidoxydans TaxID=2733484 RepID=A0ABX7W5Q3_9GAMM|nr:MULTISPECIES: sulfurtransferase TusA [Halomonas]MCE8014466.1 sulfurtransferase TusA [Halomonas sp. MCCC 1A17488]MCG3237799.1 sulfurtransferase TusA [Halomonas sp. MCCC 1A17488]QPP48405.1 sulfurtransferase TusA [Halomonas sp. SS10-MC5]QTP55716.1 sulfurtransferase TusA [Halomonas sulfidoxydans]
MTNTADSQPTSTHQAELDTTGLYCPEPIMLMHNKVRDMQPGEILKVIATDPATTRDVPKFCSFLGHELISQQESDGQYLYFIRLG